MQRVLQLLGLTVSFNFVASRDDVEQGRPDPELYFLAIEELAVALANYLVLKNSPSGVEAAFGTSMKVGAVSTPYSHQRLHEYSLMQAYTDLASG